MDIESSFSLWEKVRMRGVFRKNLSV